MKTKAGIWFGTMHDTKVKMALAQKVLPDLILFKNDNEMSMQMTTQLQQVITRYITRLTVGIISVDNTHDVPASFQIKALPTLVYHRKREIVARIVGACSRKLLESWLQKLMKQSNNLINH